MKKPNYLIGRQPILSRSGEIVAYELLFRSAGSLDMATVLDSSQASAQVILNTLSSFGLEAILGPHRGFINLELELLMSDAISLLPKDRVVLELLETLQVTPELIERCRVLKEEGFTIALDDHEFDPIYEELYSIVEIVKVDLVQSPVARLEEMVERFRPYKVRLLAEKVETLEDFLLCRDMGFELFQGYYFAKPSLMEKKSFDDTGAHMLKLMKLLNDDAEIDPIEQAFRGSPGLTYKLLLLVNSVSLGMRMKILNVRHALTTLGRKQIHRWVQLALFASDTDSGTENPLVEMAAVRAAFLEHLAGCIPELKGNKDAVDQAFMVGILSLLEAIYDISMTEVIKTLDLSDEVSDALLARGGIYGELLNLAELFEKMDFTAAAPKYLAIGLSPEDVMAALVSAYNWRGTKKG
jgi:EAL and modified HD-GYP domain-containing signal transduction protein